MPKYEPAEKSKDQTQESLLLKEIIRLTSGQIAQPLFLPSYTGIWADLAKGLESFRQMTYNFYCELQVTEAQVSSSREQIAETVEMVDSLAQAFAELRQDAASMGNTIQGLNVTLSDAQTALSKTHQVMDYLQQSSGNISSIIGEANVRLDSLLPVVEQTDSILTHIDQINRHLKILSFNAAIEAARAGMHGKGFAVVAQEMQRLSEDTYQSLRKTSQVTQQVKNEIKELVNALSNNQGQVQTIFSRVYQDVRENLEAQYQTVSNIIQDISGSKETMERYNQQLSVQLNLWVEALNSLKASSELFDRIGEAITATISRVNATTCQELENGNLVFIRQQLERLAHKDSVRRLNPAHHQTELTSFFQQHQEMVEAIYSTDADGSFLFSLPPAGLANARIRPWWQEAMRGNNYTSPVYVSAITRKPCVTIALPILDAKGGPAGVLGVDLRV